MARKKVKRKPHSMAKRLSRMTQAVVFSARDSKRDKDGDLFLECNAIYSGAKLALATPNCWEIVVSVYWRDEYLLNRVEQDVIISDLCLLDAMKDEYLEAKEGIISELTSMVPESYIYDWGWSATPITKPRRATLRKERKEIAKNDQNF